MISDRQPTVAMFRESVAVWRDPARCIPFIKGRVALYAILRTLGIGEGDEVLVPGFTCVVVPAAIIYTGARPVYYDIDPVTLQGDPELAIAGITGNTKAVLVQHNFGEIAPVGRLPECCRARGIAIIEDCAHSMGAISAVGPAGTLGTAAFCSLQWSKPTTTGLGGLALFRDRTLAAEATAIVAREFNEPGALRQRYLDLMSRLYRTWYRPSWYWAAQGAYRQAARLGIVQGSSSAAELSSPVMPARYCEVFGTIRESGLASALDELPSTIMKRRALWNSYFEHVPDLLADSPTRRVTDESSVALRLPVLVANKQEVLAGARHRKIEIGDWFTSPLHPLTGSLEIFQYERGSCPNGEAVSARVINLPTHGSVSRRSILETAEFLHEVARAP